MRRELGIDGHVAAIAAGQGGVIARRQLAELGLSASAIDRRLRTGRLHLLHRGVYAVGHSLLGATGRRWAAVLACGAGAVLSHRSAGAAWDLVKPPSTAIEVAVPVTGRVAQAGIRLRPRPTIPADEVTALDGLPITTPARTLLDLAASGIRGRALENAVDQAERRRLVDFAELHRLLARYPRRPGTPSLRAVLARYVPGDTRSELERIVAELCRDHDLPRPLENSVIEGKVRDFYWPHARLVVEADSYAWHRSPSALDDDRERDVLLTLAGYGTLRFTWEQATRRRDYVKRSILMGNRRARRPGRSSAAPTG